MQLLPGLRVEDERGHIGVIYQVGEGDHPRLVVQRLDGTYQEVMPGTYQIHNGTIYVTQSAGGATVRELAAEEEISVPVVEERLDIQKRVNETGGVRIHKHVSERVQDVEVPLVQDRVTVDRVAINRVIEQVPEIREEGDLTIIPVVEEQLVVVKQLVLREEIHIRRERTRSVHSEQVTLRKEDITIERLDAPDLID